MRKISYYSSGFYSPSFQFILVSFYSTLAHVPSVTAMSANKNVSRGQEEE